LRSNEKLSCQDAAYYLNSLLR